ncbi:MAG: porin family protein [Acidobacteria bacterium]|nr:porin family protein [Acidobacteriota bacterium]
MKRIVIFTLLLITALSVKAQDVTYEQNNIYLGVRAGTLLVDNMGNGRDVSFGAMFGIKFNDAIGIEFSYDNQFNGLFGTGWSTDAYQASLLLYLPASPRVQFYFVGGVGVYRSSYNYWADDGWNDYLISDTEYTDAGFHAGGGVDISLSPNVALTLDSRYIFVNEDTPGDNRTDGLLATAGFKFRF